VLLTGMYPCCSASGLCSSGYEGLLGRLRSQSTGARGRVYLPTCQFYLARLCLLVSFDVVTGSGQMQSGASVDDEVFVFLGPSVTDKCDDPRVLHVVCISHVRPVFCQTVSVSIGRQTLLLDGLSIFRSDCSPAVLVTFDAVVAGSNPVRHVGGILTRKC
jgi:hypothetical protein